MTKTATLTALAETQTTATLLASLVALDEKGWHDEAERLTMAVISDVLSERYNLDEMLETIYFAEGFEGTYVDAILLAMVAEGVAA